MNGIFALCVIGLFVVSVLGEQCTVNENCASTTCSGNSHVICQHPDGAGVTTDGGLCTCAAGGDTDCQLASDCYSPAHPELNCMDNARHCYDNKCICDRFVIGG